MSPKGQHSKSKARIAAYEKLLSEDTVKRAEELQLFIPPGPRLGNLVIEMNGVRKVYGDRIILDNVTFSLPPGGVIGIIGPNGAGKTTLFRLIVGEEKPDGGTIRIGESVKLGYMNQSRDNLDPEKNIWEVISGGADEISIGNRKINSRAYVSRFNFNGADQQKKVGTLSGGERNRVQLARTLTAEAKMLNLK